MLLIQSNCMANSMEKAKKLHIKEPFRKSTQKGLNLCVKTTCAKSVPSGVFRRRELEHMGIGVVW